MFEELPIIRMSSAMARHAAARHRVVAENVANADTPGFRARDVQAFAEYVNESFTARATRAGHEGGSVFSRDAAMARPFIDTSVSPSGNGNSVSLESEMIKSVEVQGQHALATALYKKAHELLRLGLGRAR